MDEFGNGIYPSRVNWSLLHIKSPFNTYINWNIFCTQKEDFIEDVKRPMRLTPSSTQRSWDFPACSKSWSYKSNKILEVHNKQGDGDYVSTSLVLQSWKKRELSVYSFWPPSICRAYAHTFVWQRKNLGEKIFSSVPGKDAKGSHMYSSYGSVERLDSRLPFPTSPAAFWNDDSSAESPYNFEMGTYPNDSFCSSYLIPSQFSLLFCF